MVQLSEACEWLDDNLEGMFVEHIPHYLTFSLLKGYPFPKRADKPRFSHQLGTYANCLKNTHQQTAMTEQQGITIWNKSPMRKMKPNQLRTFTFKEKEHPTLVSTNTPNKTPHMKGNQQNTQPNTVPQIFDAKALCEQIMKDMKNNLNKLISSEIKQLKTELPSQMTSLSANITANVNSQIAKILATISALNQCFTEVMDQLPNNPTTMPAHKRFK